MTHRLNEELNNQNKLDEGDNVETSSEYLVNPEQAC